MKSTLWKHLFEIKTCVICRWANDIFRGGTYQQKNLTTDEMGLFFSQLEALDFYTLESNLKSDQTDKLCNFGDKFEQVTDASSYCVLVNGDNARVLCAYEPFIQYLVPEMKNILQFLDEYQLEEMMPYYPDRILLLVSDGRDTYNTELPQNAILWTEPALSLKFNCKKNCLKIMYADGETAKNIYILCGNKGAVFTQNGKEYTVYIKVVLPHEEITNINLQ